MPTASARNSGRSPAPALFSPRRIPLASSTSFMTPGSITRMRTRASSTPRRSISRFEWPLTSLTTTSVVPAGVFPDACLKVASATNPLKTSRLVIDRLWIEIRTAGNLCRLTSPPCFSLRCAIRFVRSRFLTDQPQSHAPLIDSNLAYQNPPRRANTFPHLPRCSARMQTGPIEGGLRSSLWDSALRRFR
jgi:hypothetical protein